MRKKPKKHPPAVEHLMGDPQPVATPPVMETLPAADADDPDTDAATLDALNAEADDTTRNQPFGVIIITVPDADDLDLAADAGLDARTVDVATALDIEPGYVDPHERTQHELVYKMERAAATSHGLQGDKTLLAHGATLIRHLLGLTADDALLFPDAPYLGRKAPVGPPDPPIGHTLKV